MEHVQWRQMAMLTVPVMAIGLEISVTVSARIEERNTIICANTISTSSKYKYHFSYARIRRPYSDCDI